jgi:hypothetical protein
VRKSLLAPGASCIDECGINISKEATVKGIVFLYNYNKILCCPSSGKIYSIENFPLFLGTNFFSNLYNLPA